ncbi:DUF4229 domain-containing protein, partial [Dysosmobacter welbionis]
SSLSNLSYNCCVGLPICINADVWHVHIHAQRIILQFTGFIVIVRNRPINVCGLIRIGIRHIGDWCRRTQLCHHIVLQFHGSGISLICIQNGDSSVQPFIQLRRGNPGGILKRS